MFGDQISGIALPLAAVLVLHAGAAQMGYLTALEWLPSLAVRAACGCLGGPPRAAPGDDDRR